MTLLLSKEDVTKKRVEFQTIPLIRIGNEVDSYFSNIAPGDFDGDAQMDLMVTQKESGDRASGFVSISIYWGDSLLDTSMCCFNIRNFCM